MYDKGNDKSYNSWFNIILIIVVLAIVLITIYKAGGDQKRPLMHLFSLDSANLDNVIIDPPAYASDYIVTSFDLSEASGNISSYDTNKTLTAVGSPSYREDVYTWFGDDYAIGFDGSSYFVDSGDDDDFDLPYDADWTVVVWFRVDRTLTNFELIACKLSAGAADGWQILAHPNYIQATIKNGVDECGTNMNFKQTDGGWHLLQWSYDADGNDFQYQLDGEIYTLDDCTWPDSDNTTAFRLGAWYNNAYPFNGDIGGFAIFNVDQYEFPNSKQIHPFAEKSWTNDELLTYVRNSTAHSPALIGANNYLTAFHTGIPRRAYICNNDDSGCVYAYTGEAEKENLVLQSEDFTTTWAGPGAPNDLTITADQSTDQLGKQTADKIEDDNVGQRQTVSQTVTVGAGNESTFCIWATEGDLDTIDIHLDGTHYEPTISGTERVCVTDASASANDIVALISPCHCGAPEGVGYIYVWGAEVFIGDHGGMGYVPTLASTVKQEDELYTLVGATTTYEVDLDYFSACWFVNLQDSTLDDNYGFLSADSTDSWRLYMGFGNNDPVLNLDAIADTLSSTCDGCNLVSGDWAQVCVFMDQGEGKVAWYKDGAFVEEDSDTWTANQTYNTTITIGGISANYRQLEGAFDNFWPYPSSDDRPYRRYGAQLALQHWTRFCAEHGACP